MTAVMLDGKAKAAAVKADLRVRADGLRGRGILPGLGTVLVVDDPGSHTYVGGKHRDCAEVGMASIRVDLPADTTQGQLDDEIERLNGDPKKAKVLKKRVTVTFPRNSTTLSSKDRKKLQTYLRKNVTGVQVTGYVQPSGGSANDTSLALSRATKAAGYVTGTKKKVNTSITSGGRKTAKIAECVAVKNRCAVITVSYLK